MIRQQRIPTLMGNHDERIAFDQPVISLRKHNAQETEAQINYPIEQTIEGIYNSTIPDFYADFLKRGLPQSV